MNKARVVVISMLMLLVSACGTPSKNLFYWGDYQNIVYQGWEETSTIDEQTQKLQETVQMASNKSERVAPGIHAHLGMLYLKSGQRDKAIESLKQEKLLYPESSKYMDYLIGQVKK